MLKGTKNFKKGLTVRQLKSLLFGMPDKDIYGDDYTVWIQTGECSSAIVTEVCQLNKDKKGSDIYLGRDF